MTAARLEVDTVILGGGVAGLWALARLRRAGYAAVLVEADRLGAGQTRCAQGIIHGGAKYALTGEVGAAARMVAGMPARWRACLAGEGELDLSAVRVRAAHQVLWSPGGLGARLAGFFAGHLMRSRLAPLERAHWPGALRHPDFRGRVWRLDEPVVDVAGLLEALAGLGRGCIVHGEVEDMSAGDPCTVRLSGLELAAARLVLAAGAGNAALLERLGHRSPAMQRRPLHMVMVRGPLPPLYGHCLGTSPRPRLTVTTHEDAQGRPVWYLGGQLAEAGVERDEAGQVAAARAELEALFPWLEWGACDWATLRIDRAEVAAGGSLPGDVFCEENGNVITVWPTKLALAPEAAARVEGLLRAGGVKPGVRPDPVPGLAGCAVPDIAPLPWLEEERWS